MLCSLVSCSMQGDRGASVVYKFECFCGVYLKVATFKHRAQKITNLYKLLHDLLDSYTLESLDVVLEWYCIMLLNSSQTALSLRIHMSL